jgi:uncharacterized protein (TIGR00106 family)
VGAGRDAGNLSFGHLRKYHWLGKPAGVDKEGTMLVELSITPLGGDIDLSGEIAKALELIYTSGLPYQLTATATLIEGERDEVMPLVRQCHERVSELSPHVITTIKIEDDAGERNKLMRSVASVEEKVGRPLKRAVSKT